MYAWLKHRYGHERLGRWLVFVPAHPRGRGFPAGRSHPKRQAGSSYIRRTSPAPRCRPLQSRLGSNRRDLGQLGPWKGFEEWMTDAAATDGPPPPESRGARVSDRFQRSRVPVLPTVLFADANEDYRSMARDALLEGRNATDLRTVADATEVLAYLERAGASEGAVTPAPSLIVIDADLPGDAGRKRADPRAQAQRRHAPDPGRRARRRPRPADGRGRLRGRREHVHRQARHVPRARAADEGVHGVLVRDCGAPDRGMRTPRWTSSPSPPTSLATLPRARYCARRAPRARDDAGGGARRRRAGTRTT